MFRIYNNGNIEVNKGEDFTFLLYINYSNDILVPKLYRLHSNEYIIFELYAPNQLTSCPIITKIFTNKNMVQSGYIQLKFNQYELKKLNTTTYYYQIKIIKRSKDPSQKYNYKSQYITGRRKFVIL